LALDPGLVDARYNKRLLEFYRQQQQVDDQQNSGSSSDSGQRHSAEQPKGEARPGVIGNETSNPADEQRLESGYGASVQLGQLDPFEQFDGREQQRDRFSATASTRYRLKYSSKAGSANYRPRHRSCFDVNLFAITNDSSNRRDDFHEIRNDFLHLIFTAATGNAGPRRPDLPAARIHPARRYRFTRHRVRQ
jgi:hypothetical protein